MEANKILQADLLDIIFENRNKNYGAYALRKEYDTRLFKALAVIFSMIMFFYLLTRIQSGADKKINGPGIETVLYKMTDPPKPKVKPSVPQVKKTEMPKTNTQIFVSNVNVVDSTQTTTRLSKNIDTVQIASTTQTGMSGSKPFVKCPTCIADSVSSTTNTVKGPDQKAPQFTAEVMPSFPGGMDALRRFLERNLANPTSVNEGEVISVKVQFIVGYDGNLKGFTVLEDGGEEFNQEVIRVLKKMPSWIPGKNNGENVSVYYTIPVKFISSEQ